jgi:hypothetical protein
MPCATDIRSRFRSHNRAGNRMPPLPNYGLVALSEKVNGKVL